MAPSEASDDGWEKPMDVKLLSSIYNEIAAAQAGRPVEQDLITPFEEKKKREEEELKQAEQKALDEAKPPGADEHDNAPATVDDEVPSSTKKRRFFTPPLQYQRNNLVQQLLYELVRDQPIDTLAVLGCGELSLERFLMYPMLGMGIKRVVCVDKDMDSLSVGVPTFAGDVRMNEMLICGRHNRGVPTHYEVYHGDLLKPDARLGHIDCVVSTEVIEHMPLPVATEMLRVILGRLRPRVAILSTPNHEYNEAFQFKEGQFRHDDHDFEFTRQQFIDWLIPACDEFGYKFNIEFCGNVEGWDHLGGATQFAVLERLDGEGEKETQEEEEGEKTWTKVGDVVTRCSWFPLQRAVLKQALVTYLESKQFMTNKLQEATPGSHIREWRVPVQHILQHSPLHFHGRERDVVEILSALCHRQIQDGCDSEGPHILIPERVKKADLVKFLRM